MAETWRLQKSLGPAFKPVMIEGGGSGGGGGGKRQQATVRGTFGDLVLLGRDIDRCI